jgi:hypothetical protein
LIHNNLRDAAQHPFAAAGLKPAAAKGKAASAARNLAAEAAFRCQSVNSIGRFSNTIALDDARRKHEVTDA